MNAGNKLWLQSIVQYLTKPDIIYDYLTDDLNSDRINSEYDIIVAPRANMLGIGSIPILKKLTNEFEKIKIPVYVIGTGAQAMDYKDINYLYSRIRKTAEKFIRSVYNTGGNFSLRGYFTKELFDKLGFKDAIVTGCPSFYQMGRNLTITNNKVKREDFKPLINGSISYLRNKYIQQFFKNYKDSVLMDQEQFLEILFSVEFEEKNNFSNKNIKYLIQKYSLAGINLLCEGRVKLYYDVPTLFNFYGRIGYNFSFGERIHGNIAPMLNGIPSVVHYHDSRTRELAEFFNIPTINKLSKKEDLYDIYLKADYTKFNQTFKTKFDNFENFLVKYGITKNINNSEEFNKIQKSIKYSEPVIINQDFIDKLHIFVDQPINKKVIIAATVKERLRNIAVYILPCCVVNLIRRIMKRIAPA